ncbi:MAG: phosphotransferase, partial [Tumebacillaceae bacterium]
MQPGWIPEHVVTLQLARCLIEEQFPQLAPVRAHALGEGFDNTVYLVNEEYVFRFPRKTISVELLMNEREILTALVPLLPLPIPEPVFLGKESSDFPWPFLGYRVVQGNTPTRINTENSEQVATALAEFLRTLHRFPVQKAEELGVPFDKYNRTNLPERKKTLLSKLEEVASYGLFDDVQAIYQFVESMQTCERQVAPTLVHGDLHIRNLLVDEDDLVSGIIDWGDVHIGDPAIDLSIAYSFVTPEGRRHFYEVYGEVDEQTKEVARFKAIY